MAETLTLVLQFGIDNMWTEGVVGLGIMSTP